MESAYVHQPKRLLPLDALCGLIMILMAIDHANYFVARVHPAGEFWGLPLPQYNNIAEFLTRFVTHICAPGFFFLGVIFTSLFFIIRILGGFGNIHPPTRSGLISFLNVTKYPPSLAFTLLNIGLYLVLIWIISQMKDAFQRWGKPFLVFGRSSLFFYTLHLYLFAIIGLFFASRGGSGLAVMYPIWLIALLTLYPLCLNYGNFKIKKPEHSLWRFF